jgi:hypothetical protein
VAYDWSIAVEIPELCFDLVVFGASVLLVSVFGVVGVLVVVVVAVVNFSSLVFDLSISCLSSFSHSVSFSRRESWKKKGWASFVELKQPDQTK